MEFLTATIFSGVIYDLLRCGVKITKNALASRLKNWVIDDATLESLTNKLQALNLNDELSEKAIEKKIESSNDLSHLINTISANKVIIQTHSGTGDNIGGNKIINAKG